MSHRNSQGQPLSFFWEKKTHSGRSRFNLLLLEYGEYFFEDLSVYLYPVPNESLGKAFHQCDALKIQGRMKLCSRSLIFEPSDQRKPIIKYLFKRFRKAADAFVLDKTDQLHCSIEVSGFFSFKCAGTVEMMNNGKIGPYQLVDFANKKEGATILFAVVHSELSYVMSRINQLYNMYMSTERDGVGVEFMSMLAAASTNSFDTSQLLDFHETFELQQSVPVKKIRPLIVNPGCLMVTDKRVYFQPAQLNNVGDPVEHYDFKKISRIYKRRYLLRHTSLELILVDGTSAFFCFESRRSRDQIHDLLFEILVGSHTSKRRGSLNVQRLSLEHVVRQWQRREISNFEYLMYLNNEADRSMNDLTQYPVYPHIIQDYSSSTLDLKNPSTFRDLSKPIGALNEARLEHFKQRYHTMPARDDSQGIPPPFLYGTHYSTPGYVLHYLVRVAPEYMLCLQNGKFDAPDRSFLSVRDSWESCLNNPADLKELIPEFFVGNGDFLANNDDLDLGHRHSGERVNDVDLPPWAKSPRDYIRKHAKALESEYVSAHLHEWIDLIFGYKQQGEAAKAADNVFYYLTYEGAVDLEKETDSRRRRALEMQIQEFGQTPKQLFAGPHPVRGDHAAEVVLCEDVAPKEDQVCKYSTEKNEIGTNNGSCVQREVRRIHETEKYSSVRQDPSSHISSSSASKVLGDDVMHVVLSEADKMTISSPATPSNKSTNSVENIAKPLPKPPPTSGGFVGSILGAFSSPRGSIFRTASPPSSPPEGLNEGSNPADISPRTSKHQMSTIGIGAGASASTKSPSSLPRASSSTPPLARQDTAINSVPSSSTATKKTQAMVKSIRPLFLSPFPCHSEGVMAISIAAADSSVICTCSKDAYLKVFNMDSDERKYTATISSRRIFSPSDPNPVSACCVTSDGYSVFFACFDNAIYSYSITNACMSGRILAHDDCVSALDLDTSCSWMVSGSWDTAVKLWRVNRDGSEREAYLELFEHETSVVSVAVNDGCSYVAAGAEDGSLVVWAIDPTNRTSSVAFTKLISTACRRPVSCVKWLPPCHGKPQQIGFSSERLLCATGDGLVVCLDVNGRLFAATKVQSAEGASIGVNSLAIDSRGIVYGGCEDGSVRSWCMEKGFLKELLVRENVHDGGVAAVAISGDSKTLICGGENGTITAWLIETE